MSEEERLDRFLYGLKPNILQQIYMMNPDTLPKAMNLAQRADMQSHFFANSRFNNPNPFNSQQRKFNTNLRANRPFSQQFYNNGVNNNPFTFQASRQPSNFSSPSQSNNYDPFRNNFNNNYNNNFNAVNPHNFPNNRYDNGSSVPMQIDHVLTSRVCFNCKRGGHIARNCPLLKQRLQLMNSETLDSRHSQMTDRPSVVEVNSPHNTEHSHSTAVAPSHEDLYRLQWQRNTNKPIQL